MRFNQWRVDQITGLIRIEFTREQAVEVLKHFTEAIKKDKQAKFFVMSFEPDSVNTHIDK